MAPSAVSNTPPGAETGYEQWRSMRGKDITLPLDGAGLDFYANHMAELKNAQFVECHADAGLDVYDVSVSVSYEPSPDSDMSDDPSLHTPTSCSSASSNSGTKIPVRVYRPNSSPAPYPLILWFHGGGYLVGDLDTEDSTCRNIARLSNSVVLNVAYRTLSYPTPFRDGWDVLLWAVANAPTLRASPHHGFHVGGSSYGAHLATTLALHATSIGLNPPLTGQVLRSPVTLHPSSPLGELPSMDKTHPLLTAEHVRHWWGVYNPPAHLISAPSVSPLLAELNSLPPSYLQITTADPHCDEGLQYAARLKATGVPVKVTTYEGEPHTFWDLPRIKGAATAMSDLVEGLRWLQSTEQLQLGEWDTGIREERSGWILDSKQGEGEQAWRRKKLCQINGCACYL